MKNWIAALTMLPFSCLQAQTQINSFDDVQYWVGSGQNRAVVVLQWNDGLNPASVAWGYRWDGAATGLDMLRAIAGSTIVTDPAGDPVSAGSGADERLRLGLVQYSFGLSILSLEYATPGAPARTQSDWFSGYWEYFIRGGNFEYYDWNTQSTAVYNAPGSNTYSADSWASAPVGAGDRPLIDGAWDAYSFALGFTTAAVQSPTAAPLPVPVASCILNHDGRPVVSALSKTGFSYTMEYSDSLPGSWNSMGQSEPGTGGMLFFVDETVPRPPQRFYRIAVTQIP